MLRVMLPGVTAASNPISAVHLVSAARSDAVAVEIVVVVDIDVVVSAPTGAAPRGVVAPATAPHRSHSYSDAERQGHAGGEIAGRRIRDWRIRVEGWRRSPHYYRVITRHVDYLRIRLLNHNNTLRLHYLCFDLHLLVRL